mgnify:FL=1
MFPLLKQLMWLKMKDKYNKIIKNVYKNSFNIKCEMLFLVSKLKINKSNIYQIPVNE